MIFLILNFMEKDCARVPSPAMRIEIFSRNFLALQLYVGGPLIFNLKKRNKVIMLVYLEHERLILPEGNIIWIDSDLRERSRILCLLSLATKAIVILNFRKVTWIIPCWRTRRSLLSPDSSAIFPRGDSWQCHLAKMPRYLSRTFLWVSCARRV